MLAKGPAYFPGSRVVWVARPELADPDLRPADPPGRRADEPLSAHAPLHRSIQRPFLTVYDPKADGFGDTVLNWLVPLHDGKAFGMAGRVLVMLLGLMPAVMFVTGYMRWNQKRRAGGAAQRRAWRGAGGLLATLG